jgi:hypothetical protein
VTDRDLTGAKWRKSTKSSGGNDCVEVADNLPQIVAVRDTKNRDGATLTFTHRDWSAFLAGIRNGDFDKA